MTPLLNKAAYVQLADVAYGLQQSGTLWGVYSKLRCFLIVPKTEANLLFLFAHVYKWANAVKVMIAMRCGWFGRPWCGSAWSDVSACIQVDYVNSTKGTCGRIYERVMQLPGARITASSLLSR